MTVLVKAKQEGRVGPEERLVVMRNVGESQIDYALSNADVAIPLIELVRAQRQRQRIEEFFGAGKGDAGLGHYAVRSGVGWHHHMTLAMVAIWFLSLERRRVGGKTPAVTVSQLRQPQGSGSRCPLPCGRGSPDCYIFPVTAPAPSTTHPNRASPPNVARPDNYCPISAWTTSNRRCPADSGATCRSTVAKRFPLPLAATRTPAAPSSHS